MWSGGDGGGEPVVGDCEEGEGRALGVAVGCWRGRSTGGRRPGDWKNEAPLKGSGPAFSWLLWSFGCGARLQWEMPPSCHSMFSGALGEHRAVSPRGSLVGSPPKLLINVRKGRSRSPWGKWSRELSSDLVTLFPPVFLFLIVARYTWHNIYLFNHV